ncbi:MAG: hypothetical protein M0Z37_05740 [Nitrospiraceae bacterium]|nr:hypothetical protein [Nitrospiraceae bacterium]
MSPSIGKVARLSGVSIDTIFLSQKLRELFGLRTAEETYCESVQKMAEGKIRVAFERFLDRCRESDNIASVCPLLDVLGKHDG